MSKKISELELTTTVGEECCIPIVVDGMTMKVMVKVLKENLKGEDGDPGKDGTSPTISTSKINGGTRVTINDVNGTKYFDVMDGEKGEDGVSPGLVLSSEEIEGGYKITVETDYESREVNLYHGEKGQDGKGVTSIVQYYAISSDKDVIPTNYGTEAPTLNSFMGKYMWGYEEITYSDGTKQTTSPRMLAVYGDKGDPGSPGSDANVTVANITKALGYTPANKQTVDGLSEEIVDHEEDTTIHVTASEKQAWDKNIIDIQGMSLGMGEDGRIYLLNGGVAQGNGIELPVGESGDVVGNIGENNVIMLNGDIPDGTYTFKFEMDNGSVVDIGDATFDSKIYYSITKNLTNCTINNNETKIVAGGSYSATVTANSGCNLKSVTVTMGGVNVPVTNGVINISNVTGNIIINAVAEVAKEPTNFFKHTPVVTTVADAPQDAIVRAGRMSSAGDYRVDAGKQSLLTNYIPIENGDEVYMTNALMTTTTYSGMFNANKAVISTFKPPNDSFVNVINTGPEDYIQSFKITHANAKYIRIATYVAPNILVNDSATTVDERHDLSQIIINIKRNGEWL